LSSYTLTRTHTRTRARTRARAHTHEYTRTPHTNTFVRAQAHPHTHTPADVGGEPGTIEKHEPLRVLPEIGRGGIDVEHQLTEPCRAASEIVE
jgi:hypothetical protein